MTIADAANTALKSLGRPASVREILSEIERQGLFKFGAKDPASVLSSTIRKHTKGSKTLRGAAKFEQVDRGTYAAL